MGNFQKLMAKRTIRVGILWIVTSVLALCVGSWLYYWIPENSAFMQAKERIDSLNNDLPVQNGMTLINQRTEKFDAGGIDWCRAYGTHQLYGTNDSTIEQVVTFYKSALDARHWAEKRGRSNYAHFVSSDNVFLHVEQAGYSNTDSRDVDRARSQFKTAIAIEFFTYWHDNLRRYCGDM